MKSMRDTLAMCRATLGGAAYLRLIPSAVESHQLNGTSTSKRTASTLVGLPTVVAVTSQL